MKSLPFDVEPILCDHIVAPARLIWNARETLTVVTRAGEDLMTDRNDVEAVDTVQKELGDALARKDVDRAVLLMTADVTLLGPKGPPVVGREAARAMYVTLFDTFTITVAGAACTIEVVGDTAMGIGSETVTLVPTRGGRPATLAVRVVGVYRREGASWKLARALSIFAGKASPGRLPLAPRSDLLKRAQMEPGRLVYPEVA